MTILAVPSMGNGGLSDIMSPRFGRCPSFTFVTIEKDEIKAVKAVPNNAVNAMGGAGVQAAQTIGMNNANVIAVGMLGPNAAQALKALNIKILQVTNQGLTIKEIAESFIKGELQEISGPNVGSHYGMNAGMGAGRGMGRGMGRGRRNNF
jgi:predicted Fe-Mo cluster-binding NifX family protein